MSFDVGNSSTKGNAKKDEDSKVATDSFNIQTLFLFSYSIVKSFIYRNANLEPLA